MYTTEHELDNSVFGNSVLYNIMHRADKSRLVEKTYLVHYISSHSTSSFFFSGQYEYNDVDAAPDEIDSPPQGIQYMITNRMRRILTNDLGYLDNEVDAMEPQIAAVVIEKQLARPLSGMPPGWRRTDIVDDDEGSALARSLQSLKSLTQKISSAISFFAKKALPVLLPLVIVGYTGPKLFDTAKSTWKSTVSKIEAARKAQSVPKLSVSPTTKAIKRSQPIKNIGLRVAKSSQEVKIDTVALEKVIYESFLDRIVLWKAKTFGPH